MLESGDLARVLAVYHRLLPYPEIRLSVGELGMMIQWGDFGPPETLTSVDVLLERLIQRAFEMHTATFPPAPPAWAKRHEWVRWRIRRWRPGEVPPLWGSRRLLDDGDLTAIIAVMLPERWACSGDKVYNDFLALDLRYTLRDGDDGVIECLTYEQTSAWVRGQRQEGKAGRLSLSPSSEDYGKIVEFLSQYGPDFVPYCWTDRLVDDQLDYFSAFNRAWQTFAQTVHRLLTKPIPAPVLPQGRGASITSDPVAIALRTLKHRLSELKPRLLRLPEGKVVTSFESGHGLDICYVALWEALQSRQPPLRFCALPSCQRPFFFDREDQMCCTSAHAARLRVARHRARYARPYSKS
jgi:hypothetical protein